MGSKNILSELDALREHRARLEALINRLETNEVDIERCEHNTTARAKCVNEMLSLFSQIKDCKKTIYKYDLEVDKFFEDKFRKDEEDITRANT